MKRGCQINVRLRRSELASLRRAARASVETTAEFVRRAIARLVAETLDKKEEAA